MLSYFLFVVTISITNNLIYSYKYNKKNYVIIRIWTGVIIQYQLLKMTLRKLTTDNSLRNIAKGEQTREIRQNTIKKE